MNQHKINIQLDKLEYHFEWTKFAATDEFTAEPPTTRCAALSESSRIPPRKPNNGDYWRNLLISSFGHSSGFGQAMTVLYIYLFQIWIRDQAKACSVRATCFRMQHPHVASSSSCWVRSFLHTVPLSQNSERHLSGTPKASPKQA